VAGAVKDVVLGATVAQILFPEMDDPTGEIIRVGRGNNASQPFRVIGVMSPKGALAMGGDQDDRMFTPYTTVQKKLMGVQHVSSILVSARSGTLDQTAEAIRAELRVQHKLIPGDPDDFTVRTNEEIAETRTQTTRTMTTLLAAIAGVSLLVGGIGIMNIMLVSVTERTREIGLRLAIGARGKDVLFQFLVEAIVISLVGGGIGIVMGFASAELVKRFAEWPAVVPPNAIGVAFGFAAATGIFFGFYPARKAAGLDPIEALRFE
jgi:putative ABC transport system permease protein